MLAEPVVQENVQHRNVSAWVMRHGDCVMIFAQGYIPIVYHNCESAAAPDKTRFIKVDLSLHPTLMSYDQWPEFLSAEYTPRCTCAHRTVILGDESQIPNFYNFTFR